jgi:hypothetical protein
MPLTGLGAGYEWKGERRRQAWICTLLRENSGDTEAGREERVGHTLCLNARSAHHRSGHETRADKPAGPKPKTGSNQKRDMIPDIVSTILIHTAGFIILYNITKGRENSTNKTAM